MSQPFSICMVVKAITDDKVLDNLIDCLEYNRKHGAMTISPCEHKPMCGTGISNEAFESFLSKMKKKNPDALNLLVNILDTLTKS